ncbi:MAG: hypothetical protein OXT09_22075 [Myxococcales bacterium]|nr:hypothetical protein [Myxococcales bacterium]
MADPKPEDRPSRLPTVRPERHPVVLVVGGPEELDVAALTVAQTESPTIAVKSCGASDALNIAASLRPFAIVLSHDVYGFDADEFDAMARDVQAELVLMRVEKMAPGFLEAALRPWIRHAFRRYRTEAESGPVRR